VTEVEQFIGGGVTLPSLPALIEEAVLAASGQKDNFVQIARLVQRDIGLSAQVLKIANSPYYGSSHRISNVSMAISRMGTREFKIMAFSAAVINTFKDLESVLDMSAFWRHCLASSLASQLLSSPAELEMEQELGDGAYYMAGLMHHVGILVEAIKDPRRYMQARQFAQDSGWSMADSERRVFGFDHADVGAALLRMWRFPEDVCDAAQYHLRPGDATANRKTAQVVHLAAMLCHELEPDQEHFEGVAPWFSEEAFYELGWTQENLPVLLRKLGECLGKAERFREVLMSV
jgi:HD-like signal output (HDOD) protein